MKSRPACRNGFPKPIGLVIILIITNLTCFMNCAFASEPEQVDRMVVRPSLAAAFAPEAEAAPALEPWMTRVEEFAGDAGSGVEIEVWMLFITYYDGLVRKYPSDKSNGLYALCIADSINLIMDNLKFCYD